MLSIERCTSIFPQAIRCSLADIAPIDGEWTDNANNYLAGYRDQTLTMKVNSQHNYVCSVFLYCVKDNITININMNELFVELGFAKRTKPR